MNNISAEQKMLLSLLGHNLFSAPLRSDIEVDWEKLADESKAQAVFAVAFNKCAELPLGGELSAGIRKDLMRLILLNMCMVYQNATNH